MAWNKAIFKDASGKGIYEVANPNPVPFEQVIGEVMHEAFDAVRSRISSGALNRETVKNCVYIQFDTGSDIHLSREMSIDVN